MYKRFCIISLCVVLSVCMAISGFVFVIDPFNVYRADSDLTKIIYQMPYYQNTGIAKHAKYDTLITGSSMTQNFRADWFNEKFGCNAVRLSYDGGNLYDFSALLDAAFKSENKIHTVYFGIDNYLLTADTVLNTTESKVPGYLVDDNPLNDVEYLLNKDVLFNYIPTYFSYKRYAAYNFYAMHVWDNGKTVFSEKKVLRSYKKPEPQPPAAPDEFLDESDRVLEILMKYIQEHPDTEFIFFAPPYSMLYWNTLRLSGKLSATVAALQYTYGELLKNGNVRAFYFQNDFDRIENLDNYKDQNHYCGEYNRYMLDCFVSGEREITLADYETAIGKMDAYGKSLDL